LLSFANEPGIAETSVLVPPNVTRRKHVADTRRPDGSASGVTGGIRGNYVSVATLQH
jgi:hypothetical protein